MSEGHLGLWQKGAIISKQQLNTSAFLHNSKKELSIHYKMIMILNLKTPCTLNNFLLVNMIAQVLID